MSVYEQYTFSVQQLFGYIIGDYLITELLFLFLKVSPILMFQGSSGKVLHGILFFPVSPFGFFLTIIKYKAATGQLRQQEGSTMQIDQYLHNVLCQEYANESYNL